MGLSDVRVEGSSLSNSHYVTVVTDDEEIRIRVSGHEARPTYLRTRGQHDFEVGVEGGRLYSQDADGDWLDAVDWIAKRFDLTEPPRCRTARERRNTLLAEARKREEAERAARRVTTETRQSAYAERVREVVSSLTPAEKTELLACGIFRKPQDESERAARKTLSRPYPLPVKDLCAALRGIIVREGGIYKRSDPLGDSLT
jgi:hypothetical protein